MLLLRQLATDHEQALATLATKGQQQAAAPIKLEYQFLLLPNWHLRYTGWSLGFLVSNKTQDSPVVGYVLGTPVPHSAPAGRWVPCSSLTLVLMTES